MGKIWDLLLQLSCSLSPPWPELPISLDFQHNAFLLGWDKHVFSLKVSKVYLATIQKVGLIKEKESCYSSCGQFMSFAQLSH